MSSFGANVLCENLDASSSVKTIDLTAEDITSKYVKATNLLSVATINGAAYHAYTGDEIFKSITVTSDSATILEADEIYYLSIL